MYIRLSNQEELIGKEVVDIALKIHKKLGPGLLESVYEKCFCHLLSTRGIAYYVQKRIPIIFEDLLVDDGLKLDLLVEDLVIVELKAHNEYQPIWSAQLLSYLRLANKRLGYIINFHETLIKNGIKRMVL